MRRQHVPLFSAFFACACGLHPSTGHPWSQGAKLPGMSRLGLETKLLIVPNRSRQDKFAALIPSTEEGGILSVMLSLLQSQASDRTADPHVGEDAGSFYWRNERLGSLIEDGAVGRDWASFIAAVGTILALTVILWVLPSTGYGDDFIAVLERAAQGNPHTVTLLLGLIFPTVHSGLAALRTSGEKLVGARAWRVIFAFPSLCLAYSWIAYFISHSHDGIVFWNVQQLPLAHAACWCISFLSFFFLYPSVFNLKEVVRTPAFTACAKYLNVAIHLSQLTWASMFQSDRQPLIGRRCTCGRPASFELLVTPR